jgi:hypothetical protein
MVSGSGTSEISEDVSVAHCAAQIIIYIFNYFWHI